MSGPPVILRDRKHALATAFGAAVALGAALVIGVEHHGAKIILVFAVVAGTIARALSLYSFLPFRDARRAMRSHDLHWKYDEANWTEYVQACGREWRRAPLWALGIGVATGIAFALVETNKSDVPHKFGVGVLPFAGALAGLVAGLSVRWANRSVMGAMRRASREAFLGAYIYIPGRCHDIRDARSFVLEGTNPVWLVISYWEILPSHKGHHRKRSVRVPIPSGQEDVARQFGADLCPS